MKTDRYVFLNVQTIRENSQQKYISLVLPSPSTSLKEDMLVR